MKFESRKTKSNQTQVDIMVRWNANREGKILSSLFENRLANPKFNKAADIDPIKEMREEFEDFSVQQFRNDSRTTANAWMA